VFASRKRSSRLREALHELFKKKTVFALTLVAAQLSFGGSGRAEPTINAGI
jgi:hypothetical protein